MTELLLIQISEAARRSELFEIIMITPEIAAFPVGGVVDRVESTFQTDEDQRFP